MAKINDDDLNMMDYFYNERGDLEHWSSWEQRKEEIRKLNPELIFAYDIMVLSKKTFKRM